MNNQNINYQEKETTEKKRRIRYKDWKCIYPGCCETPKTRYNCTSHVWDAHLKFIYKEYNFIQFKQIQDKEKVRKLCEQYIQYCPDEINIRKRKINPLKLKEREKKMAKENSKGNDNQNEGTDNLNDNINENENEMKESNELYSSNSVNQSNQCNQINDMNQINQHLIHQSFPQITPPHIVNYTHSSENQNELLLSLDTSDYNELPPITQDISSPEQKYISQSFQFDVNTNTNTINTINNQISMINNNQFQIQNNTNPINNQLDQFHFQQSNEFIQVLQLSPS